ncbi:uncharacterized protein LOC110981396 [Acanthaster planci]|uniref:Uncharacterized protein LOC110981396 n=1 Tax=Acanthaster planci TaxID=133434 RepID=A0A8B7YQ98_ACAPL|nr:uncharacterized protein LOC110981396 [Acanthaster planci]
MHRSTSKASKQRRELIKTEIDRLRELLPLPNAVKARLSFLHVMSLACVYVRKGHYFSQEQNVLPPLPSWDDTSPFDFTQALHGFLLVMTRQGKLLYISENVTDYLGHSMVELLSTGGDLYEVIDPRDHAIVRGQMAVGSSCGGTEAEYHSDDERTFFCRMNTSRNMRRKDHCTDNKMVRIKGRFRILWSGCCYSWNQVEPVFTAVCSPVETLTPISDEMVPLKTSMFTTEHGMDMVLYDASSNVFFHLGYEVSEVCGMSWYAIVHPDYIETARKHHQQMLQPSIGTAASRCAFILRLLRKDSGWLTVSVTAWLDRDSTVNHAAVIMCQNLVIREDEIAMYESQALHESLARRSASCLVSPSPASASGSSERFSCSAGDDVPSPWPDTYQRPEAAPACPTDSSPAYGYEGLGGQTQRTGQPYQGETIPYQYLDDRRGSAEWGYDGGGCYYQGTPFVNNSACQEKMASGGWDTSVTGGSRHLARRDIYHGSGSYGPYSSVLVGPARTVQSLRPSCSRKECLADRGGVDFVASRRGPTIDAGTLGSDPCPALRRAVLEWARRLKAKRQVMAAYRNQEPCFPSTNEAEKGRKRSFRETVSVSPGPYKAEVDYTPCGGSFSCSSPPTKRRLDSSYTVPETHQPHINGHPSSNGAVVIRGETANKNELHAIPWAGLPRQQELIWWTDSGRGGVHHVSVPDSILTPESSPSHDGSSPGKLRPASGTLSASPPETGGPAEGNRPGDERPGEESEPNVGTLEAAVGKALFALSSDELRLLDQATLSLLCQNNNPCQPVFPKKTIVSSDDE